MKRVTHRLRGYVRPLPRIKAAAQAAALHAFGVEHTAIYTEGEGDEGLDALVRSLRRGEGVAVTRLHLLAPPKGKTNDKPRRALWSAVQAIEAKGAHIVEVETGRNSMLPAERDAMIADAIEQITHSGRTPRKRDVPGRPPIAFTPDEIEFARREWFDLRHATNAAALAAIRKRVPKWTMARCFDKAKGFGPSGRKS